MYDLANQRQHYKEPMKAELALLVAAERKHARELKELRDLRVKTIANKPPDQKILAMIDAEIKAYTEPK